MYKHLYSHFLSFHPEDYFFTPHSHHFWPDVTLEAMKQYWIDSAKLVDHKWELFFGDKLKQYKDFLAIELNLNPSKFNLSLAPNTHDLFVKIVSHYFPKKVNVLSSDSEFHSFKRQALLWEKNQQIHFETFKSQQHESESLENALLSKIRFDVIFVSHVFFNTGQVFQQLETLLSYKKKNPETLIIIDCYHSFMAIPIDWSPYVDHFMMLGGSYKYAQAGEGLCFAITPKNLSIRPTISGWFANFSNLSSPNIDKQTAFDDDFLLFGSTFDLSPLYRALAVFEMLQLHGLKTSDVLNYVRNLENAFLNHADLKTEIKLCFQEKLVKNRGRFLLCELENAETLAAQLQLNKIHTDVRGQTLRLSFALYHDQGDVDHLVKVFNKVWTDIC